MSHKDPDSQSRVEPSKPSQAKQPAPSSLQSFLREGKSRQVRDRPETDRAQLGKGFVWQWSVTDSRCVTNHSFWFTVPTGIKDLTLYPLGPTAVVLSWNRPFLGVFRKYVVEMFYFNPSTMTSEWTTYYEIAATVSLTASVVRWPLLTVDFPCLRCPGTLWALPSLSPMQMYAWL